MGRERQKKKKRSSIPKVRPKKRPRRVNPLGNPLIAANWDKSLTLSQNYRRLGLTSRLNAPTGGIEKTASEIPDSNNKLPKGKNDSLAIKPKSFNPLGLDELEVERDPETGAVLKITDPKWKSSHNPLNDPLNDLSDEEHVDVAPKGAKEPAGIVKELEQQALIEIKKKPRHQSQREREWLQALVDKHGDDFEAMSWDKKLNPNQQTAADIRRRVKKWKE